MGTFVCEKLDAWAPMQVMLETCACVARTGVVAV